MSTDMSNNQNPILHGGNLHAAIQRYGIPRADWLDLSTGISPFVWPVPDIPTEIWQRLPEPDGALENAALQYYGKPALPIPGSQWAIQQLPALFAENGEPRRVWLPQECYEEYRHWWQFHGHTLLHYAVLPAADEIQPRDVVIVLNPNNPTALYHAPETLLALAQSLQEKNGWLILDEAFMDATPEQSLLPLLADNVNVLVLRSLGKFFGLAGIRTGFILGNRDVQMQLQTRLGPWAISHPAQWIAIQALQDTPWQQRNIQQLQQHSTQLLRILESVFPHASISATPLFASVQQDGFSAQKWQHRLAQQGILVRCFPAANRLRFGLADAPGLQRLEAALVSAARHD